jgi:5-methylcytosine-specific restriction enzyme A
MGRFRTDESRENEQQSRALVPDFLRARGLRVNNDVRRGNAQVIDAVSPWGERLKIVVRLCWKRDENSTTRHRQYSAAQIISNDEGDAHAALERKVERERQRGITHFLFVQPDTGEITRAALIPIDEMMPVWEAQRDASDELMRQGVHDWNHSVKGTSPVLWLMDERDAQSVADALWDHDGVIDLMSDLYSHLPPEIADAPEELEPQDTDRRNTVFRQIRKRRGQRAFRDALWRN